MTSRSQIQVGGPHGVMVDQSKTAPRDAFGDREVNHGRHVLEQGVVLHQAFILRKVAYMIHPSLGPFYTEG